ncbi:MAG: apolipoprotein N-acyltransferase [Gammaproteobacteria bacterium]|nr:apolipoprotein N-acyltransferase [Gammaproteobacteria bacterium]
MIHGLIALVAGALLPLSLAPFDLWPLGLLAVGVFFHLLQTTRSRGIFIGWMFGVGKYGVGVSWVYVSIHDFGNASPLLASLLVCLFVAGLALFVLANGWLFCRVKRANPVISGCLFICAYVAFEWLLTWFLTGFPWLLVGYGHLDTMLAGFAPVGGVLLVSLMAVTSATGLAVLIHERRGSPAVVAGLAAVLPWLLGAGFNAITWVESAAVHDVALVQGNIDQRVKWLPESRQPIIDKYLALSEPHWDAHLIVWPEASITLFAHQATDLLEALDKRGKVSGTALVLGLPELEVRPGGEVVFKNTALGLGTAQGSYVKRRLVPFGEYVPLENLLRGLIDFFDLPMSRAEPGDWRQPLLQIGDATAALAICYEIAYPALVREGADVLLTISNDTWFGDSIGPLQHLQMARMRAVENGRWLLRATNNGLSAIVDERGVIRGQLPQFEAGVLRGEYRRMAGVTPYARLGDWPLLGLLLGGILISLLAGRKTR